MPAKKIKQRSAYYYNTTYVKRRRHQAATFEEKNAGGKDRPVKRGASFVLGDIDSLLPTFVGNSDGGPFFFFFRKHTCPEKEVREKKSLSANDVLSASLFLFCGCPRKEATARHCRRNREGGRRLWPLLSSPLLAHFYAQQNSLLPPPPRGVLLLYVHSSDVEQANVRTKQRAASAFADKERVSSVPPP